MDFVYIYKTSDGARHEARISAPGRDDAFAALRERGIRPIKLFRENSESPKPRFFAYAAVFAAFALAVVVGFAIRGSLPGEPVPARPPAVPPAESSAKSDPVAEAANGLAEAARAMTAQAAATGAYLDFKGVARIREDGSGRADAEETVRNGSVLCGLLRSQAMELFRDVDRRFAGDGAGAVEAKRLYGILMSAIDSLEERVQSAAAALDILDETKGTWRFDGETGRATFDDAEVQAEYNALIDALDPDTARWQRDFGRKSVESGVIGYEL